MAQLTLIEKDKNNIATLWINRPDVRNALNGELIQELIHQLNENTDVRALVIRGKGTHFCAGADLKWMKEGAEQSYDANVEDASHLATLLSTLDAFPAPTIAHAHGGAYGGAIGLLACCDVVIADPGTLFSFSEAKLGLIPAIISPYVIRRIGEGQTRRYFLTAEQFDGTLAETLGLVHQVAPLEQAEKWVTYFTDHFLAAGPDALKATKDLMVRLRHTPEKEKAELTAQAIAQVREGEEAQAGIAAFFAKEKPPWGKNV